MAHCSCLQVLGSGCLLCQRVSLSLAVFLLPFELFFLQQRLQGWVHPLWTAWQGCKSSICWKPSKGVADSRAWPLAAVYHRNWPCLCLHVIWKFLGNKQSSGSGVIVSASALQIMRSSFKRSLKQYYIFLKGKCDCSWLLRCMSSVWGGGEECRAQSNEGGKGEHLPVHVQLPQKGRLNLQKANREGEIAHGVVLLMGACRLCRCVSGFRQHLEPRYILIPTCLFITYQNVAFLNKAGNRHYTSKPLGAKNTQGDSLAKKIFGFW